VIILGRVLFFVNDPLFLISHRLQLAKEAQKRGYVVHVASRSGEGESELRSLGFKYHSIPLSRSGMNPFWEFFCFLCFLRILWRLRPRILHLVTVKPVLYGGIAARLAPVGGVVAAISGLGFIFTAEGKKALALRGVVGILYRIALGHGNLCAIFQNEDDRSLFIRMGAVTRNRSVLIRGSGVNLSLYKFTPERSGVPVVTFAARLLHNKGVAEFVEVARLFQQRGIQANFQLVGDRDPDNPTSVGTEELARWRSEGIIEYLGYQRDIARIFADSNIVVLPSYREGLPKVLVEAAACGRAVVTTDVPGCRDAIEANTSGLLVPVRDVEALAVAIQKLLESPELRRRMGMAGRQLAEREYDIDSIVQQHLKIYRELGV